jgi:hypothetical protein
MLSQRNDRLEDRRRRVLTEEVLNSGTAADDSNESRPARKSRDGAARAGKNLMQDSRRITELIPQRASTIALLFLTGLTIIAGLEALYAWMPELANLTTDGRIAAFDLDGEGSLPATYSALLLTAAGLASLMVYSVRKRRADDYHARYRLWLWAALCWFVMALDESSSLHEGFKELMARATGERIYGDGSIWWIGAYGIVLGILGLRILIDARRSIGSTVSLIAAGVCWALAVVLQIEWLMPERGAQQVMVEEGMEMVGALFLVLAMVLQARYAILEAQGQIGRKAKKSAETATRKRRSDAVEESAPAKPTAGQTVRTSNGDKLRFDGPAPRTAPAMHSSLSKAERKALKRSERQQRRDEID